MPEVTRKTVLALVEETTRGTPVSPSAATDFTALQEDASMSPSFEELENAELSNSIAQKQVVLGLERPEMSFSHYIRHSGVEATAPDYNLLLKSIFGDESIAAAEYDTVASSTAGSSTARAVIKVDTDEGATFQRGEALLIKDATNTYSVRNIYSISTDDLTLGFNIADAPVAGVNLGKAVLYSPASDDSDYPTLSGWKYDGNGAAIELVSGLRCTDMSIDISAGELINGSFTLSGLEYYFNPIVVTSANKYIEFIDDGASQVTATLTEDTYKDPNDFASHVTSVLTQASVGNGNDTITCSYSSSTGKFSLSSDGATFSLLWKTGTVHGSDNADDHAGTLLGFDDAADDTGATSYFADNAQSWAASYTPDYDDEKPCVAKNIEVMWGDFDEYVCKEASSVSINVTNEQSDVNSICAVSGRSDTVFSRRTVTVDTSLVLTRHEVDTFTRFREATSIPFACNWGRKSGGNWVAGSVSNFYIPDATITSFEVADEGGLIVLNLSLRAYIGSDQTQEVFMNFL